MTDPDPMTAASRRYLIAGAVVVALVAGGIAAYFSTDSGAREGRKGAKGPPAVPVTVALVAQETVPIELRAIGNVEAYSTVALKARVEGQIVAGNLAKANDVNPLLVINQVRPVYVNFAVPEQNLPEVRKYMAAGPLRVEVLPTDAGQKRVEGKLIFIDNAVDPTTATIRLRAQF